MLRIRFWGAHYTIILRSHRNNVRNSFGHYSTLFGSERGSVLLSLLELVFEATAQTQTKRIPWMDLDAEAGIWMMLQRLGDREQQAYNMLVEVGGMGTKVRLRFSRFLIVERLRQVDQVPMSENQLPFSKGSQE